MKKAYTDFTNIAGWFLGFMMVGISIMVGVAILYPDTIDTRYEEALALNNRLITNVALNGILNYNIFISDYDLLNESKIDKKIIENGKYYINLTVSDNEKTLKSFVYGNKDFLVLCELPGKDLPKCIKKEFYVLNKEKSKFVKVEILTGSNYLGEKI